MLVVLVRYIPYYIYMDFETKVYKNIGENIKKYRLAKGYSQEKLSELLNANSKFILCGDFNYDNVNNFFPNLMTKCKDLINIPTRKDKQLDHIIVSNKISISSKQILENNFDHKLCIIEIEDNI